MYSSFLKSLSHLVKYGDSHESDDLPLYLVGFHNSSCGHPGSYCWECSCFWKRSCLTFCPFFLHLHRQQQWQSKWWSALPWSFMRPQHGVLVLFKLHKKRTWCYNAYSIIYVTTLFFFSPSNQNLLLFSFPAFLVVMQNFWVEFQLVKFMFNSTFNNYDDTSLLNEGE